MHTSPHHQPPAFGHFVAVDWSGAKGPRLPGLQVATCQPGHQAPRLIRPPNKSLWTRTTVWQHIVQMAEIQGPVLAAFDMGLGLPYMDCDRYFPGLKSSPPNAESLWQQVDQQCQQSADFYAGPFCQPPSKFAPYFNAPGYRGPRFDIQRCRVTEQVCRQWTRPSSVFNGVGAGSVGLGSLAGMRLLHHVTRTPISLNVAIWPFEAVTTQTDIVIVEMFPRLYALQAKTDPRSWRQPNFLPTVLKFYDVQKRSRTRLATEDEMDAYFSAAALRHLAAHASVWNPPQMTPLAAGYEGWIFGVHEHFFTEN